MAYTQSDVDALDAEIATIRTAKATTSGDQSTTFRDLAELLQLRALMQQSVNAAADSPKHYRVAAFDKGV